MRYAIFADIHSNLEALEAVISSYTKENIDKYLCVGDIVGYGANPSECISRLKNLKALIVGGNHDWASVGLTNADYFNPIAKEAILWTEGILSADDKKFLKSLELIYEDKVLTLVHGSLNDPERFYYIMDTYTAHPSFELLKTQVGFVGQSHVPVLWHGMPRDGRSTKRPGSGHRRRRESSREQG